MNPTISVCIIAKNEENNIYNCINSVNSISDEIILLDTGSTDKTIEIAKQFDKVKVYETIWEDNFSKARNLCISYATGEWILILDADEEYYSEYDLREYIKNLRDFDIVNIPVENYYNTYSMYMFKAILYKKNSEINFKGFVHDFLYSKKYKLNNVITDKFILRHKNKGNNNSEYYIKLTIKSLKEDKNNPYYYKHLANDYINIEKYDLAIYYYIEYLNCLKNEEYIFIRLITLLIDKKRDYKKALKYSKILLEYFPNNFEGFFYQGYCYLLLTNYKKAIISFKNTLNVIKSIDISMKSEIHYKSLFGIGLSYYKLNNKVESFKYFTLAKHIINTNEVNNYLLQLGEEFIL